MALASCPHLLFFCSLGNGPRVPSTGHMTAGPSSTATLAHSRRRGSEASTEARLMQSDPLRARGSPWLPGTWGPALRNANEAPRLSWRGCEVRSLPQDSPAWEPGSRLTKGVSKGRGETDPSAVLCSQFSRHSPEVTWRPCSRQRIIFSAARRQ